MYKRRMVIILGVLALGFVSIGIFLFGQKSAQAERNQIQNVLISGETVIGEITPANPTPDFLLAANPGDILTVSVVGISPDMQPILQIIDGSGEIIAEETYGIGDNRARTTLYVFRPDRFSAQVQSANGDDAQFAITVEHDEAAMTEMSQLAVGDTVQGQVNADDPMQMFALDTTSTAPMMMIISSPTYLPPVMITDSETGQMVGQLMPPVHAGMLCVSSGMSTHQVNVMYSGAVPEQSYEITLVPAEGEFAQYCNPSFAARTAPQGSAFNPEAPLGFFPNGVALTKAPLSRSDITLPTDVFFPLPDEPGACTATSLLDVDASVHSLPVSSMQVVSQITDEVVMPVIGSVPDNSWLQVVVGQEAGWINTLNVDVGGGCGCGSLPIVNVLGWEPSVGLIVDLNGNLLDGNLAEIGLQVDGLIDAPVSVNTSVSGDGVNATVGAGGVTADVGAGADGVNANVGADGLNADVGAGDGGVNVDVGAGDGGVNVDVGAGDGGVNVDVGAGGDGGVNVDVGAGDAGVSVGDGGVDVDLGGLLGG